MNKPHMDTYLRTPIWKLSQVAGLCLAQLEHEWVSQVLDNGCFNFMVSKHVGLASPSHEWSFHFAVSHFVNQELPPLLTLNPTITRQRIEYH